MKFNFKIQQYQTDAVEAVVKIFNGQGFHDKISYIRDLGKEKLSDMQITMGLTEEGMQLYDPTDDTGYKNEVIELTDEQLLKNIQTFVEYLLGVVAAAYRELSSRVSLITTEGMSKPDWVKAIIRTTIGTITKKEILEKCPDIS